MSKFYFVGSGIAALAGAAYLIRDAAVDGRDITLFEESTQYGGALDAHGDAEHGYFMSGSRMFESKYNCTFDLLSSIPSRSDERLSITAETNRAAAQTPWNNRARLVDRERTIVDSHSLGFSERDRVDLLLLTATPEYALNSKRITDCFPPEFFNTNFWFEWCTLFAFQPWHSAIEFKRYLLRFMHHFSTIDTQAGVYRTKYNQYDSIAVPLVAWLRDAGVTLQCGTTVLDLGFRSGSTALRGDRVSSQALTVTSLTCTGPDRTSTAPVVLSIEADDFVFVTNGSMTADKSFGSMHTAPVIDRSRRSGAWRLWHTLAEGRPQFGNPSVFDGHIERSLWESFTVTDSAPLFLDLMRDFSGSKAGQGGLITFKDSNWLITLSIFRQPFFAEQRAGESIWWGYGLKHDRIGNFVRKPMAQCTGKELLEEVLGHLQFGAERDAILATSNVIPCMMPYITSEFLVRKAGDRPEIVPAGSTNLAFIGQYCEQPDEVVFTVEYSIRSAQAAVYKLLQLDVAPTPLYKGAHDPRVLLDVLETLHR